MNDVIDLLTDNRLAEARLRRPAAKDNAQLSFDVLFDADDALPERYEITADVAGLHSTAKEFYAELAEEEPLDTTTPERQARLDAALRFAELLTVHPADATERDVDALGQHFSSDEVVTLAQIVSFLAFQLRVIHAINAITGDFGAEIDGRHIGPTAGVSHEFSTESLGWRPWVQPLAKDELTDEHMDALIKPERAHMPYFRLLVRNPGALKARTLTDLDIFYNTDGGLTRAERELAATITSRINGCPYCASVHQARAKEEGADPAVLDGIIAHGVDGDLGSIRWNTLRDATRTLTMTPMEYNDGCVAKLRAAGLDEAQLLDHVYATAFFNWANRLMLTLGRATYPH